MSEGKSHPAQKERHTAACMVLKLHTAKHQLRPVSRDSRMTTTKSANSTGNTYVPSRAVLELRVESHRMDERETRGAARVVELPSSSPVVRTDVDNRAVGKGFCVQAPAAAIIPFSGVFAGELEPPLLLHYVHIIGLSDCRLVRWPITPCAEAAWPTVSSQSALYEAFTGAACKVFSPTEIKLSRFDTETNEVCRGYAVSLHTDGF